MSKQVEYVGKSDVLFIAQLIYGELTKYQKAVSGKGLSTEDFTTAFKTKLDNMTPSDYATHQEVIDAVASATGLAFVKPAGGVLPATGEKGKIYLIPSSSSSSTNAYDEYYWDDDAKKFELFGSTAIDLTDYQKSADITELATSEIQSVWDSVFGA